MFVRRENTRSIHVHHFLPLYPHIVPMIPLEHRFPVDPQCVEAQQDSEVQR